MGSGHIERSSRRRPRITKRACVALTLLLFAGAIVNVAVAWGCVLWGSNTDFLDREMGAKEWPNRVPDGWPSSPKSAVKWCAVLGVTDTFAFGPDREFQQVLLYGLPMRSMMMTAQTHLYGSVAGYTPSGSVAWSVPQSWRSKWRHAGLRAYFPTQPRYLGFAINTVFYAAILWLLFVAPFALRRRSRVKRGLCPKCAYDLRGRAPMSDVCPECGAASTRQT